MSAIDNVRFLPAAAALKMAELQQKLELATFAATKNAETCARQMLELRKLEDENRLLKENGYAAVIAEHATDFLAALFEASHDVLVPVEVTLYRCDLCGTASRYSGGMCHERKRHPFKSKERIPFAELVGDLDLMPAREQAELLLRYAFGEAKVTKCDECQERTSECVCPT